MGLRRIHELERWIQSYYRQIGDPTLRTAEASSRVVEQVYALKAELGNILFVTRGALDEEDGVPD